MPTQSVPGLETIVLTIEMRLQTMKVSNLVHMNCNMQIAARFGERVVKQSTYMYPTPAARMMT
jgi:hypothetical protein